MASFKITSRTTLAGFEDIDRSISRERSWKWRMVEGIFLTKIKVRLFGVRIHHSYVGTGFIIPALIQQLSSIYGVILLALGATMVVHDIICHLLHRQFTGR